MLDIENLEQLFHKVVNSDDWKELQEKFNECEDRAKKELISEKS